MKQHFLPLAEYICVGTLPSVPIADRAKLPKEGAIYFVLNHEGIIQYIGRTSDLHMRWGGHHRLNQYRRMADCTIAWLTISNHDLLPAIEKACIEYFQPKDNGNHRQLDDPSSLGKIKVNVTLDEDLWIAFRIACLQRGTSASKEISRFMIQRLAEWKQEKTTTPISLPE